MPRELFEMVLDGEGTGVELIALVDVPAIQRNWIAFNADGQAQRKVYACFSDDEKRVVAGPLLIPDLPIRRVEGGKEFDVFVKRETIELSMLRFMKQGNQGNFNIMHDAPTDGVFIYQTYLIDSKNGVNAPNYYKGATLPDGTWFAMAKVENDAVWEKVKDGTFQGFSIEGVFGLMKTAFKAEDDHKWLEDLMYKLKPDEYDYLENLINSIK